MLSFFVYCFALTLLFLMMYGLYLCSDKQFKQSQQRWKILTRTASFYRWQCVAVGMMACVILAFYHGWSVGLFTALILLTPMIWLVILLVNPLKLKQKSSPQNHTSTTRHPHHQHNKS